MQRLVVYACWPRGTATPKFRKAGLPPTIAVLVTSSAAPAISDRWMSATRGQLNMAARTIGAAANGTIYPGLIAKDRHTRLPDNVNALAMTLANRLVRG